jgi:2-alkyl-3-oxoalkanoate reductase
MRILVTGATSLLGATVATTLAKRGDDVTCLQRRPSGTGLRDVLADITDGDAVRRAAEGHDAIIHLAALVAPRARWQQFVDVNVGGTANVLAAAAGCGRLVHISTPSVAFHNTPAMGPGTEPPGYSGRDGYARSKAIAERMVVATTTVPTVVLRPHLVWGPGDTQLVGRIVDRATAGRLALPRGGAALVDSTYVTDAADAIVAGLDATADPNHRAVGHAWVVSAGDPRPVRDLVASILTAAGLQPSWRSTPGAVASVAGAVVGTLWPGSEPPLTHFAARQLTVAHWFDQRQARDALAWEPAVGLDAGFVELARWFSDHRLARVRHDT